MGLNVTESTAVNTIALYLLGMGRHGHEEIPSQEKVLEALAQLSDSSYKRLHAGIDGEFVRQFSPDVLPVHTVDLEPIIELGELFDASTQILEAGMKMATIVQEDMDSCRESSGDCDSVRQYDDVLFAWAAAVLRMRNAIAGIDIAAVDDDDDDDQVDDELVESDRLEQVEAAMGHYGLSWRLEEECDG